MNKDDKQMIKAHVAQNSSNTHQEYLNSFPDTKKNKEIKNSGFENLELLADIAVKQQSIIKVEEWLENNQADLLQQPPSEENVQTSTSQLLEQEEIEDWLENNQPNLVQQPPSEENVQTNTSQLLELEKDTTLNGILENIERIIKNWQKEQGETDIKFAEEMQY